MDALLNSLGKYFPSISVDSTTGLETHLWNLTGRVYQGQFTLKEE